jgi:iron complex transport system substrate-binding protein
LARDPGISTVAAAARDFPDNRGSAELILHERADLVLGLPGAASSVVTLLRRLGVVTVIIDEPTSIAAIAPTIRRVAALLGRPAQGEAAITTMQEKLAAVAPSPTAARPAALFYDSNGLTAGGNTLEDDVLTAAGLDNYARQQRLDTGRPVSLETIVARPPDLLVTRSYRPGDASLAESWPDNPVLRTVRRRAYIPDALLICGTPAVADAAVLLAAASRAP